jgi:hypothetical protein
VDAAPDKVPRDGVPPVWLTLVPFEVTELDADDLGVDGLALAEGDPDEVALGFGVCVCVAVTLLQGLSVALAVALLPVALVFAVVEAVAGAVVAALLAGVPVELADADAVLAGAVLPLGLALLLLGGLELVLLPAGLVLVTAGVTVGLTDLLALAEGDGEEPDGHAGGIARTWLLAMLLELTGLTDEVCGLPTPAPLGAPLLLWGEEVSPTAEPSWTKAWRRGGTARATPTANKTQAAARAGRSSPSRQSRG